MEPGNVGKVRIVSADYSTRLRKLFMQVVVLLAMGLKSCKGQVQAPTATPTTAPAPAPAPPAFVNVTQVLALAGEYSTFVSLMVETKVDLVFQNDANQTQTGITIFAPTNKAFTTKLASTLLKNLTEHQKVSLVEYHALNTWLPLSILQQAHQNLTTTLATYNNGGGRYQVNLTDEVGMVQVVSAWTTANVTSTLYSQKPVSIFALDEVLLPYDIFGLPSPAPAPSPSSGAPIPSPSSSSSVASGPSGASDSSFAPPPYIPSLSPLLISLFLFKLLKSL